MNRKRIAAVAVLPLALLSGRAASAQPPGWKRVEQLQPTTDITITTRTQAARKLTLLQSDEAGVTVVNLAGVPYAAKDNMLTAARQLWANNAVAPGRSIVSGPVVMAPDAVFIDGRRIGTPSDFIETIPRPDVVRITRARINVANKALAAVGGAVGGFFAGGYGGSLVQPACRCDDPGLKGMVFGAPIGAVLGGIAGAKAITSHTETIYEAAP